MSSTRIPRVWSLAIVAMMMALLLGSGPSTADQHQAVSWPDHGQGTSSLQSIGLDPNSGSQMLRDHFRIEHRTEVSPLRTIHPVLLATWIADHFALEHRADQNDMPCPHPAVTARLLADHFRLEHRDEV